MTSFSERLTSAMNTQGLKQVDLIRMAAARNLKLGKSHMSQYVSGKTVPRAEILHFLAEALQVEESWLKGQDELCQNEPSEQLISNTTNLSG